MTSITQTISHNIVMWETRHTIVDWVCFKILTLLVILRTQNQPQEVSCVFLEVEHLFQSVGCARNRPLSSHSSTESEIISLDAGLRMDGLPALDLCDIVIEVLRSTNNTARQGRQAQGDLCGTGAIPSTKTTKTPTEKRKSEVEQLSNVDYVPTNTHSSHNESQLYIDWLFDRINLEPEIQINFVSTKNQLADILTKGSFSRDEWNHLLCFFNLMSSSMYSCSHFSNCPSDDPDPIGKQNAMSKKKKKQKTSSNESSPTAKAKPCLVLREREQRSEEISSQCLGSRVNPEYADERQELVRATRQLVLAD